MSDIPDDILQQLFNQFFSINPSELTDTTVTSIPSPPNSVISLGPDDEMAATASNDLASNIPNGHDLAQILELVPGLPWLWNVVLLDAYIDMYNLRSRSHSIDAHSVAALQAIKDALIRCGHLNMFPEDVAVAIDGNACETRLNNTVFKQKIVSAVSTAGKAYLDRLMEVTLYLLTSQVQISPPYTGLMLSHHGMTVPGPIKWWIRSLLEWKLDFRYQLWHWHNNNNSDVPPFRPTLSFAVLISPDCLDVQHILVRPDFTWTWETPQVLTVEAISDVLAMYNVCLKADFLRKQRWHQDAVCPWRREAFDEERNRIYSFLAAISRALPVPGLSGVEAG
ncbi:hypothetical protein BDN67DRAFT_1015584 [Paxillus ammoniavirescens]|nr:hypothetical protein BDN67DRAFT_1015584 [Paxillus ammoniavirescens]